MEKKIFHASNQSGFIGVLIVVILLAVSLVIASGVSFVAFSETVAARHQADSSRALLAAEGSLEDAILRLVDPSLNDPLFPYNLDVGGASVTISRETLQNGSKKITALADFAGDVRKIEAIIEINASAVSFHYGAQVGEGGVNMKNGSRIIGNVYSNGSIIGQSGAIVTGDALVAGAPAVLGVSFEQTTGYMPFGIQTEGYYRVDPAQQFRLASFTTVSKVSLYLAKNDTLSDASVFLVHDDNGKPARPDRMISSGSLEASRLGSQLAWIDVNLSPERALNPGNYWIVINTPGLQQEGHFWKWGRDSNSGYENGRAKTSFDWTYANWDPVDGDLAFRVYSPGPVNKIDTLTVQGNAKAHDIRSSTVGMSAYGYNFNYGTIGQNAYFDSITSCTIGWNAYFNVKSGCTVGGQQVSPNTPPEDLPPADFPVTPGNIAEWQAEAESGSVINGNYTFANGEAVSVGPAKITGNLTVSNNSVLTVTGTIYVLGEFLVDNGATVQLAGGYGSSSGVILVGSETEVKNNSIMRGSGSPGSYLMVVSIASDAEDAAVKLDNGSFGSVFSSTAGTIKIKNNTEVKSVAAYRLELDNNAVIRYEDGLVNAFFTSGPGASWRLLNWEEVE